MVVKHDVQRADPPELSNVSRGGPGGRFSRPRTFEVENICPCDAPSRQPKTLGNQEPRHAAWTSPSSV